LQKYFEKSDPTTIAATRTLARQRQRLSPAAKAAARRRRRKSAKKKKNLKKRNASSVSVTGRLHEKFN
jgi:hypothetical protein